MQAPQYGVRFENVSEHGGSHVSKSHSRPRSIVSVREKFDDINLQDRDEGASHVSARSRKSLLAPSHAGSHRSRSEHRYSADAPPPASHATAPVIVVSEDSDPYEGRQTPSIAPSHRSSHSRGRASEAGVAQIQVLEDHVPSESGRSHRSSRSTHSRSHSHHRSRSISGQSDTGSRLTHDNLATLSRSGSPERTRSHAPSLTKSHHTGHSRSGSHASTIRVAEIVEEKKYILEDAASLVPSRASHHSTHSRRHSHAGISPLEVVEVVRAPSVVHSNAPSRAASQRSGASRGQITKTYSVHEAPAEPETDSDNDSIYPESSISQRSERTYVSHAPSHHSHHSQHSRHLAPSHAPSVHSSHSHRSAAKALSQAPSHHSHVVAQVVEQAPSIAPSRHSTHSHHSNLSSASTLKGSREDHESPDRQSHVSNRSLKGVSSHDSQRPKVEAPEAPPAVMFYATPAHKSTRHEEYTDSDDDIPDDHGGSVALLHKRQKYKREVSRGRAEALAPLEERPECCGEGFRPHRSKSHRSKSRRSRSRRSRSHSGYQLEKGIIEVTEGKLIRLPKEREVRRERERDSDQGWLRSEQRVVAVKKERNGAKLFRIM